MQRLVSVGGSLLTSDRISHAVLNHAAALTGIGRSEVLEVPALFGAIVRNARLLLSAALPLWSFPVEGDDADLPASAAAAIEQRTAALTTTGSGPGAGAADDYEFLDYAGYDTYPAHADSPNQNRL